MEKFILKVYYSLLALLEITTWKTKNISKNLKSHDNLLKDPTSLINQIFISYPLKKTSNNLLSLQMGFGILLPKNKLLRLLRNIPNWILTNTFKRLMMKIPKNLPNKTLVKLIYKKFLWKPINRKNWQKCWETLSLINVPRKRVKLSKFCWMLKPVSEEPIAMIFQLLVLVFKKLKNEL